MAAGSVAAKTNGVSVNIPLQESEKILEYKKIIKLHDDLQTNAHPRLKIPVQTQIQGIVQNVDSQPPVHNQSSQNGVHKLPHAVRTTIPQPKDSHASSAQSGSFRTKSPASQHVSATVTRSSGIDPVLLTKSDVVVKAELQQKRHRIERVLEEQLNQRRVASRQRTFDQDALPDLDVTEVLKKAQELVKPFKPNESNGANRTASSSDSFDENTFYSSQMNESPADDADESAQRRPRKICKFFSDGHCRFGEACIYSHDRAPKEKLGADGLPKMDLDKVNTDDQAGSRRKATSQGPAANKDIIPAAMSQHERIAELEEQLRVLKSQTGNALHNSSRKDSREARNTHDEPTYSPPDTEHPVSGQHNGGADIREAERAHNKEPAERRVSANLEKVNREYARNNRSPLSSEVRVIRNHITSPAAPQPARVSPLAVARIPQIDQRQRVFNENKRHSQGSGDLQSPREGSHAPLQPVSRKRRRENDTRDRARNVMQRREVASPEIRIKEEPTSPIPFKERSEANHTQDVSRPIYINADSPRFRTQERIVYQPRIVERPAQGYSTSERTPITPLNRSVITRNGHSFESHDEQDLRRVVSARQVRLPRSPLEQYAIPQASSARAASQVYHPQSARAPSRFSRTSVQPLSGSHVDRDRSLSPLPRSRFSPSMRDTVVMAPPRRIVIDQHGQRYFEAPVPTERQASVIPLGRQGEFVPRYEQHTPHHASIRDSQVMSVYEEGPYVRRAQSPVSPHYIGYQPAPKYRQTLDRDGGQVYGEEVFVPRNDNVRMIERSESRPAGQYEEFIRPLEELIRTQSVRPSGGHYEAPREHVVRVQSVRPDQDRIINLERSRNLASQVGRQVSVRADDGLLRTVNYARPERSNSHYATEMQEHRYVDEDNQDNIVAYEPSRSSGRRPLERI